MRRQSILLGVASARESIYAHRLRSSLALLGVTIGVMGVLAISSYGEYARAQVTTLLAQFGSNLVAVTPGTPLTRAARVGRVNTLTLDDAVAVTEQVPHLVACSAVKSGSVTAVAGRYKWNTQAAGVNAVFSSVHSLTLSAGDFFDADADRSTAAVAVIGSHVAERVFPGVSAVGGSVRLNGTDFRVVGVLTARGQSLNGNLDDIIYVPLNTAVRRLYGGSSVDRIEVRVDGVSNIDSVVGAISALLEHRHHIAPGRPDDFQVQNFQQVADRAASTNAVLGVGLTAAAAVGLAIGGFGVMNIMLLSVSERTPEIGVRLAVGARSADVRAQFLAEAVTLCFGGALIGACVGLIGAAIISQRIGVPVVPPLSAVLVTAGISAAIGLVFGLYPAERAAHLDPIVALRSE